MKHVVTVLYYVILCYVMLCYVMLCYVMLCYVMLCYVILYYIILYYINRGTHWLITLKHTAKPYSDRGQILTARTLDAYYFFQDT